ncbi:type II toxin-antitoxin system VapC family toxin [Crocosphaera sp. XPORK-15E]|uniref:type II toxin-antitoxin system VapC family toxin n=1 Tax=Crocosphaera sp. XPORK-15E TaxID=3110247 RepID=UPI002B217B0F|nr:type II toxin-antitoxin system VapC family toxin [Crocosphaera sp. XPORK-15E]MEA5536610.1 type II toxin-antitoxin system VapC family toxin [Crocosphaera sp. XPORK-15E]
MNLLLDTHCWLWALSEPEKLNPEVSGMISDAITAATLPLHHKDPFDRMIIAQGISENLPILTNDNVFRDYDVTTIAITR